MVEAFLTPPFQILDFIDKELVRLDQTERGTSIQGKGDPAMYYNGSKRATHKHSFKNSAKKERCIFNSQFLQ